MKKLINKIFKKTIFYIVLIFLVIIFSVLGLELFAYIYFIDNNKISKITWGTGDYNNKKGYSEMCAWGWCPRTGVWTSHKNAKLKNGDIIPIYRVTYSIDEYKRRIHQKKTIRDYVGTINLFGGSFAFGEGLNDNQTINWYLSKFFPNYKINNFGFHGYGVQQALYFLENDFTRNHEINILLTGEYHIVRSTCNSGISYFGYNPNYCFNCIRKTSFIKDCSSLISKHKYNENDNWNEEKSIFLNWNASPQWGADMNIVKIITNTILPILNHMKTSNNQLLYQEMITDFYYESSLRNSKTLVAYIQSGGYSSYTFNVSDKTYDWLYFKNFENIDVTLGKKLNKIDDKYTITNDGHPSSLANCERASLISQKLVQINYIQKYNFIDFSCEKYN